MGEWGYSGSYEVGAYLVGFTGGYFSEQAMVTYVTGGAVAVLGKAKFAKQIVKLIREAKQALGSTTKIALKQTVGNAVKIARQKVKNTLFRLNSANVISPDEVQKLKRRVHQLDLNACGN